MFFLKIYPFPEGMEKREIIAVFLTVVTPTVIFSAIVSFFHS